MNGDMMLAADFTVTGNTLVDVLLLILLILGIAYLFKRLT